jgi:hypothetical protein
VSRIDRKIGGEDDQPADAADILAALARDAGGAARQRQEAVSCYLSGSEGWQEALALLGGAFAKEETGLKASKDG